MKIFNRFPIILHLQMELQLFTYTHTHRVGGREGSVLVWLKLATIQKSDSFKSVMYGKTFHVKRKKQFTFTKFPFHLVFFYSPLYTIRRRGRGERGREPAYPIETLKCGQANNSFVLLW